MGGEYTLATFENNRIGADSRREFFRRTDWEELAQRKGIPIAYLHIMGGQTTENWVAEYDTAGQNEASNKPATVEFAGRDLQV